MSDLRDAGVKTMASLGKDSVRTQLGLADKFGAPYTIIIGLTEVREGVVIIRDMKVGTQKTVPFDEIVDVVIKLIGKQNLDTYSAGELTYE